MYNITSMYNIAKVRINYADCPVGISGDIQIGWKLESDLRNEKQQSYQIQISETQKFTDVVYDSGLVESQESAHIVISGMKWKSLKKYYVRCNSVSVSGQESGWSQIEEFITSVQDVKEFQGQFITAERESDVDNSKGTYVRKEFQLQNKEIDSAYLVSTALGLYDVYINGQRIGEDELKPGWTSYHKRLLYQTYDVKNYLNKADNAIGAMIGAGWYKGLFGFLLERNNYGNWTAFYGLLTVHYTDGSSEEIYTDTSWKGYDAPVLFAEIYDGEIYDARKEEAGWNEHGFMDRHWRNVAVIPFEKKKLVAQTAATVRKIEYIKPKRIFQTPQGDTVVDFGQNLTGWVEFKVQGNRDDVIKIQYFEVLDSNGNVYLDNLRSAKEKHTVTLKDSQEVVCYPHFTFMGFQYICIEQFPENYSMDNFTACVIHSDMEETGSFECSNPLVNQLQHNIKWSMKGNFLDVPTDCPQRDERCGWTGDAQIFGRTASYLMNTYTFYEKWLADVAADQTEDGGVPDIVPDILTNAKNNDNWLVAQGTHSASAWADVAVIVPWVMYLTFGDKEILKKQYQSMKAWIDFMQAHSVEGIWNYGVQLGDWVALDAEEGSYFGATPTELTCTAYYAYSSGLFAKIANVLGNRADYKKYQQLHENIVQVFQTHFFAEDGSMTSNTQTAHILALYFNLVPEKFKAKTAEKLVHLLEQHKGHLVTGFVGTPYFCHALSQNGYDKEAYDLLLKEDFPSWLYQVKMGATTIWEHWDGLKPDGTMWSADMNSFNHYAYGAVGEWLYRVCAGLEVDEDKPGYQHIIICPHIGGFSYVKAEYNSVYGTIGIHWNTETVKDVTEVSLAVRIPVNTTATIVLNHCENVIEGDDIKFKSCQGELQGDTGSGDYRIRYTIK